MRNLILVKHSLPEIVPTLPAHRWHLSEEGRLRCRALAEKLDFYSPGCILSSREPKAVETAQLVADHLDRIVQIIEGLHEHDRSPDCLLMWRETASQARERFTRAVTSALCEHPNDNVALVAHGTVITLFVAQAVGLEPFGLWRRLGLPSFVVMSLPEMELANVVEGFEGGDVRDLARPRSL